MVGHPLSVVFCFYAGIGLVGLTYGFILGSFSMGLLFYITLTCFCNWEQISVDVRKKMKDDGEQQKEGIANGELKVSLMH